MAIGWREKTGFLMRSLTIMGSWNFPRMQGLGFFYIVSPFLERFARQPQAAMRRHFSYFNTHPYMASYILGAVAALEEEGDGTAAVGVRNALMGPLGASGDGLFWAGVKPMAVLLGMTLALFNPVAGAITLLVVYNACHLWARWNLFELGYANSHDPLTTMAELDLRRFSEKTNAVLMPVAGFLLGAMGTRSGSPGTALLLFLASVLLYRCTRNWMAAGVIMFLLCLLLARLGLRIMLPW